MNRATLSRFLPFLAWFPLPPGALRADLIAGLTVALVLVPQSMAYAQLAGLAPVYGLYTAFLPCWWPRCSDRRGNWPPGRWRSYRF
jgi:MFS superfamily sulfate permease-like transporter